MLLSAKHRNTRTAESVARFWGKSLGDRDWYDIKAMDDGDTEIRIYDVIGWPFIDADNFVRDLNRIESDHITVAINSPGGDVFDGTAIFNALRNHPANITTRIDGLAASMASIIALAGDTVQMASNAYYMIHNPWTFTWGDEHALRKEADLLGRIGGTLAETYVAKTGKSAKEVQQAMDDESWFIGSEAADFGFVDEMIGDGEAISAKFDAGVFAHAPDQIKQQDKRGMDNMPSEREIERTLTRDAGLTRSKARALIAGGYNAIVKPGADDDAEKIASVEALNEIIERNI
jgi:ATP-dependent protease ClpP protease subunit